MSAANVELIRRLVPGPEVDVAPLFRDQETAREIAAAFKPLFAPDFECVAHIPPGPPQIYSGWAGLRTLWLEWLEPWASYSWEVEQLIDAGEHVLMLIRDLARLDPAGPGVAYEGAVVWTVRDGKITHAEFFEDRAEALKAARLNG